MDRSARRGRPEDLDALWDLFRLAFGMPDARRDDAMAGFDPDRALVVEGPRGEIAGASHIRPFTQWFGGRPVPMGGFSPVAVAPEHRGRGLGRAVTAGQLADLRQRGEVISCLFPASLALYRSVGFEIAGSYVHRRFPAADVAAIDGGRDVDVRRGTAADLVAVHRCHSAHVRSRDGAVSRSPQEWATRLPSDLRDTVLHVVDAAGRPGEIDGYAAWRPGSGRPPYDYSVVVSDVVADDPEIVRALWRVVASSGTQAPDLHVIGPADDDLLLLVPRAAPDVVRSELRWMLRLVDAPAAVAARGWPAAVAGRVDLEVHDDDAPWNAGRWVLEVGGGTAELRPGGSGAVGVSIGALSSWWAGGATASRLRRAGHLVGDPVAVAAMDELVGSAPPVLTDFF